MLGSLSRDVFYHYFDLAWHSLSQEPLGKIIPPAMSDVAQAIKMEFDAANQDGKRVAKVLDSGQAGVQLNGAQIVDDCLVLLIGYADKKGADPVLLNIETGDVTLIEKGDDQGLAYSAHCIISLTKNNADSLFNVMLEKVPGATRSIILPFINMIIKSIMKSELTVGGKKKINVYPKIEILSKPNSSLKKALTKGYVDEVEFVKYSQTAALAAVGGVIQEVKTLKWKLNRLSDESVVKKAIQLASDVLKAKGYDDLKVRFKTGAKTDTIPVSKMSTDAGDYVFNQRMTIRLDVPVAQFSSEISTEIRDKMIRLINENN